MDCEWGLGLGVRVGSKDSVSMDFPLLVKTFGRKYCELEWYGLGSSW